LVRVLSEGPPPSEFVVRRSGFGAGTKDFPDRANAVRIWIADYDASSRVQVDDGGEAVFALAADLDDSTGEEVSAVADRLRDAGALDVVLLQTVMKKGRPGVRIEALATPDRVDALERLLLTESSSIGVRAFVASRRVLARERAVVRVDGQEIALKVVQRPDGQRTAKPEADDVSRAAAALGRPWRAVADAALAAWRGA
jgi:uncharacterized protein (DUF111 family)